jgi:hypothetical protein
MKITSSQLALSNDYRQQSRSAVQVSMVKAATPDTPDQNASAAQVAISSLQIQQSSIALSSTQLSQNSSAAEKADQAKAQNESHLYGKSIFIMKMLLEKISGKKIELFDPERFAKGVASNNNNPEASGDQAAQGNGDDLMQVTSYQFESQSNKLLFSGEIEQQNGDKIQFSFGLSFSQEYESVTLQQVKREQLKDPLVISFTNKAVALSSTRFEFDIDNDQQKDNIAMLEAGHGFLALDRNGDKQINNGSELFGALSGNGFSDLAQYDEDQNGFIDENDSVFSQLSIWIKNKDEDKLLSLDESGVGAIALDNVDTPLTLRTDNEKLGYIRKSGFYLDDKGKPGLVQQLDFIV